MTVRVDVGAAWLELGDDDGHAFADALRQLRHLTFAEAVEELLGPGADAALLVEHEDARLAVAAVSKLVREGGATHNLLELRRVAHRLLEPGT